MQLQQKIAFQCLHVSFYLFVIPTLWCRFRMRMSSRWDFPSCNAHAHNQTLGKVVGVKYFLCVLFVIIITHCFQYASHSHHPPDDDEDDDEWWITHCSFIILIPSQRSQLADRRRVRSACLLPVLHCFTHAAAVAFWWSSTMMAWLFVMWCDGATYYYAIYAPLLQ